MADSGTFKWGESRQLGDQALEICAAMDKLMVKYLDFMKEQGLFDMAEEDPACQKAVEMYEEMVALLKHCEMWTIDFSTKIDVIDHKLDKVMRKLESDNLK